MGNITHWNDVPIEAVTAFDDGIPAEAVTEWGEIPDPLPTGGDTAIVTMGYDGSTYKNWMESMNILEAGSNAISGYHVTAHYGCSAASNGGSGRGLFSCGVNTQGIQSDYIEYVDIPNGGDSAEFGNSSLSAHHASAAASNGENDRMVSANGATLPTSSQFASSEYHTISTTGNATQHSNTQQARQSMAAMSNATNEKFIVAGGYGASLMRNQVDQMTINTLSAFSDWGDLSPNKWGINGVDNGVNDRGVWLCGQTSFSSGLNDTIDYLTISTGGSCVSPGFSCTVSKRGRAVVSNKDNEAALALGGIGTLETSPVSTIDAFTINSLADATLWGGLTSTSGPECEGVNDN